MGKSYPDRTNATGIWKLKDITRNKITDGTYPGAGGFMSHAMGGGTGNCGDSGKFGMVCVSWQ